MDNLDADAQNSVFSFISIDGDREDRKRALRAAARSEKFFGCFFVSDPDFEFGNFELWELEEILWKVAMDKKREMAEMTEEIVIGSSEVMDDPMPVTSASDDAEAERALLHKGIEGAATGKQLVSMARRVLSKYLGHLSKNEAWGAELMRYAMDHPTWKSGTTRPIVEAIHFALRARDTNYTLSRERLCVDPISGRLIEQAT